MAPGTRPTLASEASDRQGRWWPESGALSPLPFLDGLRAVAVLAVMLFHAWWSIPGQLSNPSDEKWYPINYGRDGVHLFFVLSAFLLFLPYARWLFGFQERPSARLFYRRRLLRVGPAYWVSLAILALVGPWTLSALGDVALHTAFLSNLTADTAYSINGVFWTMAIEVQFYAMLPLLGLLAYRVARRVGPLVAGALLVCAMTGISGAVYLLEQHIGNQAFSPILGTALVRVTGLPHWLSIFSIGIACSLAYVYLTRVAHLSREARSQLRRGAAGALLLGLLAVVALATLPALQATNLNSLLFGLALGLALFGLLFGPAVLRKPLESRVLRFVGLISYSLYIWHTVVLGIIEPHLQSTPSPQARVALGFVYCLLFSLPIAYLSYQLTERPFIAARKRSHESPPKPAIPASKSSA